MTTINATSYAPEVTSTSTNVQTNTTSREVSALNTKNTNVSAVDTMETNTQPRGKDKLKLDIKQGKADLSGGILNVLIGGTYKGDIYLTVPKGTPMFEIKQMYNLPDGALQNYCRHAGCPGGDMDVFRTITDEVWFSAEDFAKGNHMTLDQVKALFNK